MFKKNKTYAKLPGTSRKLGGCFTLWMGPDHLLSVESKFIDERYKRFFFKDIQALVLTPTHGGTVLAILALLAALLCAWQIFFFDMTEFLPFLIAPLAYAAYLIYQKGSCMCWIQTPTQVERLPSLNRRRKAQKIVADLRAHIEKAQGGAINLEAISSMSANTGQPVRNAPPAGFQSRPAPSARPGTLPPKTFRRQFHKPLFILTLFTGLLIVMEYWFGGVTLASVEVAFTFALWILLIMALVRQAGTGASKGLKGLTWVNGVFNILLVILGYIFIVSMVIKNPEISRNHWLMLKTIAETSPQESPFLNSMNIFHIAGNAILGVTGLIMAWSQKAVPHKATPVPATPMPLETAASEEL